MTSTTHWARSAAAALLLFATALTASATEILFIGNSYTYGGGNPTTSYNNANVTDLHGTGYGGVPGIFKKFCDESGLSGHHVSVELVGGKSLKDHYVNWRGLIGSKAWDLVVLQEQSYLSLATPGDPSDFYEYSTLLERFVHGTAPDYNAYPNVAAKVYLYQTPPGADAIYRSGTPWSNTSPERMVGDIHSAYFRAASMNPKVQGVIAVGDAWVLAMDKGLADRNPYDGIGAGQFNLWQADNHHPSSLGNYFDASIIWGRITGLDPRSLGPSEAAAAALGISPSEATTMQSLAWQHLQLTSGAAASTVVYANDFDGTLTLANGVSANGPVGGSLAPVAASTSGSAGKAWSGKYFQNAGVGIPADPTTLTLEHLPPHSFVSVDMMLAFLDSWDSGDGNVAPDELEIFIDDAKIGSLTAANASGTVNAFGGGTPKALTHWGANASWKDRVVDMATAGTLRFPHSASSLTLKIRATGAGWQGGNNESWGMDSLSIRLSGP